MQKIGRDGNLEPGTLKGGGGILDDDDEEEEE
jgi:hypothetical protein